MSKPLKNDHPINFPNVSVIAIVGSQCAVMTVHGEIITHKLSDRHAIPKMVEGTPILTCHAPWTAEKLNLKQRPIFDVLELFVFCHPGVFITPTLKGLADFYKTIIPFDIEDTAFTLIEICKYLLEDLQKTTQDKERDNLIAIAKSMTRQDHGWAWGPYVINALGGHYDSQEPTNPKRDMDVFSNLAKWAEEAPPPHHSYKTISGEESRAHLQTVLNRRQSENKGNQASQIRAQQQIYATRVADMLIPKNDDESPNLLIAQAGTGIGKTFGYLAPAQLWAEQNEGRITVSTYTKNLQRQIEQDLPALYPEQQEQSRKVITQKGRENYLCLLNLEELIARSAMAQNPQPIIAAGLMARWVSVTQDGDLTGTSFPGWLGHLLGINNTVGLADRRGECIYAACSHYHKCYIEKMNRKAKRAKLVISNHALTMIRAASDTQESHSPFLIFDEAHHLFHAADSAFGVNLSGLETADLRRWLVGPENDRTSSNASSSRGRGLRKRLEGLIDESSPAFNDIGKILINAKQTLPAIGWRQRVFGDNPFGAIETFLFELAKHVQTRNQNAQGLYSIECDVTPVTEPLIETATKAQSDLKKLRIPLADLSENLKAMMEDQADDMDADTLNRLESLSTSIEQRATLLIATWMDMLDSIIKDTENKDLVDWFEIARIDGKYFDCGFMRRFKNPMQPLGDVIRPKSQGIILTSATLKPHSDTDQWQHAFDQLGTNHLTTLAPEAMDLPSPFDYAAQSRIYIVTDVNKQNGIAVANAYKALFEAANGGGLGLFTSIQRLKQVYKSIRESLERKSIPLFAQHHDNIDIGTLTDMFREDDNACLLGTDAVRDGINVSGKSLRLMVFDRVPWPRPTILHRERKKVFGGRSYDENETRMKLKQAYGRLIRSETDKGIFVLLDNGTPSRLYDAFPPDVQIERVELKDAVKDIKEFL
jgi:ATP-dependent DNA helicase DinG